MSDRVAQLQKWMKAPENEHLEFKEAKGSFEFEKLVKYCSALANECGGVFILGVTDMRPRRVVGSKAFESLERTKAGLTERLRIRVEAEQIDHPDGRVLVFHVPSRPMGMPIPYDGAYWMRAGEDLVAMTPDQLKRIFDESEPDFSATLVRGATLDDLDAAAIEVFRSRWHEHGRAEHVLTDSVRRLLENAELIDGDGISHAALVLLGTARALSKYLAQCEIVFEYRAEDQSIGYQQRAEYRQGFLLFHDALWATINLRNDVHSMSEGLFRREVPSFNESAVREAVLNAVCHRDYRLAGSTFVRQTPTRIRITSPGGLPTGITPENILFKQSPRNRRLAEAMGRCGLVERSGQGADRMFQASLREGKLPPDFTGSDAHEVVLTLQGKVQDETFVKFLDQLAAETGRIIAVEDLVILDRVHRDLKVPAAMQDGVRRLVEMGAIEKVSSRKLVLAKRFYSLKGTPGEYTRRAGLDVETRKELLLKHIRSSSDEGSPLEDLQQVLPDATRSQLKTLLTHLRRSSLVHMTGSKRGARWFPGPGGTT